MSDQKLRGVLIFRIPATHKGKSQPPIILAKFDHAAQYESHSGATPKTLYGRHDKWFADLTRAVIHDDPPTGLAPSKAGSSDASSSSGLEGSIKVVRSEQHQLVYGADADGIGAAIITGLDYPARVAFQMLQELYTNVMAKFASGSSVAATAMMGKENSLSRKAKNILSHTCAKYSDASQVDKTRKLLDTVEAVKSQVQDNITEQLENMETADSVLQRSEQLTEMSNDFRQKSKTLRKQMAWKHAKITLLVVFIIIVILASVLGPLIKRM